MFALTLLLILGLASPSFAGNPASLVCPKGWHLYTDTSECVSDKGAVFVSYLGRWWNKIGRDPSGRIFQNLETLERLRLDDSRSSELQHFVGQSCVWAAYPYPTFAHGQQFQTTDYKVYQCNNGTTVLIGNLQPPVPPQQYYSPSSSPAPRRFRSRLDEYYWRQEQDLSQDPGSGAFYKS